MAKKIMANVKLQISGGEAKPSPPVGPALGQHGVNIMEFCKAFNAQTQNQQGVIIPVVITIYADRSFSFVLKTPPASYLLKKAAGIGKGSAVPNRNEGREAYQSPNRRDSQTQNARSKCQRSAGRCPDHHGLGPQSRDRSRRLGER